jgi:hypothetical protein
MHLRVYNERYINSDYAITDTRILGPMFLLRHCFYKQKIDFCLRVCNEVGGGGGHINRNVSCLLSPDDGGP